MAEEKPGKIKTKRIKVDVPEATFRKYHDRCEKEFGNQRKGNLPLLKFINRFANGDLKYDDL